MFLSEYFFSILKSRPPILLFKSSKVSPPSGAFSNLSLIFANNFQYSSHFVPSKSGPFLNSPSKSSTLTSSLLKSKAWRTISAVSRHLSKGEVIIKSIFSFFISWATVCTCFLPSLVKGKIFWGSEFIISEIFCSASPCLITKYLLPDFLVYFCSSSTDPITNLSSVFSFSQTGIVFAQKRCLLIDQSRAFSNQLCQRPSLMCFGCQFIFSAYSRRSFFIFETETNQELVA